MRKILLILSLLALGQWANAADANFSAVTNLNVQSVAAFVFSRSEDSSAELGELQNCKTKAGYPCGIYFNVAIDPEKDLSRLSVSQVSGTTYKANTPGTLTILIFSSETEKMPLSYQLPLLKGVVTYNKSGAATLAFGDEKSTITLAGSIEGQLFAGDMTVSSKSAGVKTESLGQITTNICSILACK